MTSYINKDFIVNFSNKIDIIILLGSFVKLEKKGSYYLGLCPFHSEKTPSFVVNKERKRYICFGCNAKGDAYQFFMDYKNINFFESLKQISEILSIELPHDNFNKNENFEYALNINLNILFKENLKEEMLLKSNIYKFFVKRKLYFETLLNFEIGFCNNSFNKSKKINNESCENVLRNKFNNLNKNEFKKFNNRIIFPIKNYNGKIIGFGGRALNNNVKPKYMNSSKSNLFNKSTVLYGIYESKKYIQRYKNVIIVEGYIDVISLHQFDIKNAVSILGTSFTKDHLDFLKNITSEIIFCYDGDEAGLNAAWKTANLCLKSFLDGFSVKFVFLPLNLDPDSYVNINSKKKFLEILSTAVPILDYVFSKLSVEFDLNTFSGKYLFIKRIFNMLKNVSNNFNKALIFANIKAFFLNNNFIMNNNFSYERNSNYNSSYLLKKYRIINVLSLAAKASIILLENRMFLTDLENSNFILKLIGMYSSNLSNLDEFFFS